jgi:hypothetical protein
VWAAVAAVGEPVASSVGYQEFTFNHPDAAAMFHFELTTKGTMHQEAAENGFVVAMLLMENVDGDWRPKMATGGVSVQNENWDTDTRRSMVGAAPLTQDHTYRLFLIAQAKAKGPGVASVDFYTDSSEYRIVWDKLVVFTLNDYTCENPVTGVLVQNETSITQTAFTDSADGLSFECYNAYSPIDGYRVTVSDFPTLECQESGDTVAVDASGAAIADGQEVDRVITHWLTGGDTVCGNAIKVRNQHWWQESGAAPRSGEARASTIMS